MTRILAIKGHIRNVIFPIQRDPKKDLVKFAF